MEIFELLQGLIELVQILLGSLSLLAPGFIIYIMVSLTTSLFLLTLIPPVTKKCARPFKFINHWVTSEHFMPLISNTWADYGSPSLNWNKNSSFLKEILTL